MGEGGGSSDACRLRARTAETRRPDAAFPVFSILKGSFSKSVSTRQPGECGGPEGYLQGQVRHPSVACGDTSPYRGGFRGGSHTERLPCKGSWMRRKAQTEGCIAGLRWNYLARSGRALPRSTRRFRKAPRRARLPALHCGRKRAATRKRQPASTPNGGPMQASAPTQGRAAAGRMRRPGRALPPCFAGCAAAGRVRRPGRVFAGSGAAPLRRLRRHLPLQGRLLGWRSPERLLCKGSWMRRKAQTEGCIAALRRKYPAGSGRALPPCFAGGMWRPGERGSPEGHWQGQVRHPSVACGDTSPYRGGFRGRQRTKRLPCKRSLSSSGLLKAASPVKGRRWCRLPYPSTVTSVRRTWPASQASRSRMQGAGRLPAVRSTRP